MIHERLYKTAGGSTVRASGAYYGRIVVDFDWVEEGNACVDCEPIPDCSDGYLHWDCDNCGGGIAKLELVEEIHYPPTSMAAP